jgi:hypothetical protein
MALPADDSELFFVMARKVLVHAELAAPAASDWSTLFGGLTKIATGLEILSAELKATCKELAETKGLLQQAQAGAARRP